MGQLRNPCWVTFKGRGGDFFSGPPNSRARRKHRTTPSSFCLQSIRLACTTGEPEVGQRPGTWRCGRESEGRLGPSPESLGERKGEQNEEKSCNKYPPELNAKNTKALVGPGCWGSPPLKFLNEPPTFSFRLDLVASDPHLVLEGLKTSGETGSNGHPRVCLKETFKPFSIGRETHREEVSELLVSETGFTKGTPWGYPPPVSSLARTCHASCCFLLFTSEKAESFRGSMEATEGPGAESLSLLPGTRAQLLSGRGTTPGGVLLRTCPSPD